MAPFTRKAELFLESAGSTFQIVHWQTKESFKVCCQNLTATSNKVTQMGLPHTDKPTPTSKFSLYLWDPSLPSRRKCLERGWTVGECSITRLHRASQIKKNRNPAHLNALKKCIVLEFSFLFCPDHYPCITLWSCQRECPRVPWINFHPAHSIHSSPIFKWIQMEMDGDGPSSFLKPEGISFSTISHQQT